MAARQLRRYFKDGPPAHPAFDAFLEAVSEAYLAADADRELLERTLQLASEETESRYRALERDVEARKKVERERDAFFIASPDMLTIVDSHLRIVHANESWERTLGYTPDELKGKSYGELVHPSDLSKLIETAQAKHPDGLIRGFEYRLHTKRGDWRWVSSTVSVDEKRGLYFSVTRDVTEERARRDEQAQAHKLEAIGQLASGVAHEINNPIQYVGDCLAFVSEGCEAVFAYVGALEGQLTEPQREGLSEARRTADVDYYRDEVAQSLADGRDGVRRVSEMVRALKEFAHPDLPQKVCADLNKAIERAVTLARGELKHVATVQLELSPLPAYPCHVGRLSQAFVNLLVNAAHAIDERAHREHLSAEQQRIVVSSRLCDDAVEIAFTDTGSGVPEDIRERIFEPFFTTKPMGKGSGQGLPQVRSTLQAHGGTVSLQSEPGKTTFTLRLPREANPLAQAA